MALYRAIFSGPPRNYTGARTTKRYIAIHNTANDATAEQEASYATRRTDSTSSHYYVDRDSLVQSLDTDLRAWHAGSREGNDRAISYEITGVNGWTRAQWLDRVAWPLLAAQIRRDCAEHGIVPRHLSVAQIKAGSMTGFITHNDMRLAWGGTDHTDPGPNFPMDHLLALVASDEGSGEEDMPTAQEIAKATVDRLLDTTVKSRVSGKPVNLAWTVWAGAHEAAYEGRREQVKLAARVEALLAQQGGQDVAAAVEVLLEEAPQRERPERQAELGEITEALEVATAERRAEHAALAELVARGQSGELDAAEVVRLIGEKLTAEPEPEPATPE